jgi:hypothetical protein
MMLSNLCWLNSSRRAVACHHVTVLLSLCCCCCAALHGLAAEEVQWRLANFLKHQLSVALVLDTGVGSSLALTEAAVEFVER